MKVNEFKSNYKPLFWNIIWYFSLFNLNYDMILPYRKKIQQEKNKRTIINPNNETIKLIYNNDIYTQNEKKLKEINSGLFKRESSVLILGNHFEDLEIKKEQSFEIKNGMKNKKVISQFINHMALQKSLTMRETKESPSLKIKIKDKDIKDSAALLMQNYNTNN